jgi:hypothetical protein
VLTAYQTRVGQLLQYPAAPNPLYSTTDITSWINQARQQLAGEGECIRYLGTITVSNGGGQQYPFATLAFSGEAADGVAGALNVRNMWLTAAGNALTLLGPRPFEWLSAYALNTITPFVGPPTQWAQLGQGESGTFFLDNLPDQNYTLQADCVWQPIALANDSTVEAIPYPWTDAVAYYAAYLALLSAQSAARQADAARMFERYENFVRRARTFATPSVLPTQYPQNANPLMSNQLGMPPRQAQPQ